jgi:hypothetical protein
MCHQFNYKRERIRKLKLNASSQPKRVLKLFSINSFEISECSTESEVTLWTISDFLWRTKFLN